VRQQLLNEFAYVVAYKPDKRTQLYRVLWVAAVADDVQMYLIDSFLVPDNEDNMLLLTATQAYKATDDRASYRLCDQCCTEQTLSYQAAQ
jgi:hypothetical protein